MITGLIALINREKPIFVDQPLEDWQKKIKNLTYINFTIL